MSSRTVGEVCDAVSACRLFRQPLVPLVTASDGKWLVPTGLAPILKPGGHGAIWKLMLDAGVFSWLYQHDREAAIVRQIRYAAQRQTLLSSPAPDSGCMASLCNLG